MNDRRGQVRIPIVSIARLTPQGLDSKRSISLRDISTHGVGIYSQEEYQKGELVLIELNLTEGDETMSESISGEVVWVAPLQDERGHAVGIRFEHMEQEKPALYAFIKRLEDKRARRDPSPPSFIENQSDPKF